MADPETRPDELFTPHQLNTMKEGRLYPEELFWRDHQPWLQEHGYNLRSRYRPNWVASWLTSTSKPWYECEDAIAIDLTNVLDATRADGTHVALKRIDRSAHPDEAMIGQLFSTDPFSSHPHNHCIPIHEVLPVPDMENTDILVMPLLYNNGIPPFETIGEVLEFFRQIFEGLQFMHENHVAHRDCKYDNIMADVLPLYRSLPHPWQPWMKDDFSGEVKQRSSRTRTPIRYYLVDFGLSEIYKPEDAPPLELPRWGGDKTVPEFRNLDTPCDPFPVDVYCLGNAIRTNFLDGVEGLVEAKKGFDFMRGLVNDMINDDPTQRPTMDQVVSRFDLIMKGLSGWKLRSRVVNVDERPVRGVMRSTAHLFKQLNFIARRVPAIPRI